MEIIKYTGSIFFTNTYLITCGEEAIIIDPTLDFKEQASIINNKYNVKAVLLTHGHIDHMDGARYFKAPIYIGLSDYEAFFNDDLSLYKDMNIKNPFKDLKLNIIKVRNNDSLKLIGLDIKVIYTPGHTKGSVCYLIKNDLFSGDSLFYYGIPRYDFINSNLNDLKKSINKLFSLDPNLYVHPGHDEEGLLGNIKKNIYKYLQILH